MDSYAKPPITEAVIEVRSASPITEAEFEHVSRLLQKRYKQKEELREFSMTVGPAPSVTNKLLGYRLTNEEASFVAQPRKNGLSFSSLAPYPGWEAFTGEFEEVLRLWRKAVGSRKTERFGVRFMNRIDIPREDNFNSNDYLNVGIVLPPSTSDASLGWQVGSISPLEGSRFSLGIRCGSTDQVLIAHASYTLDLDFFVEVDAPHTDTDIMAALNEVREIKNRVFEECITDQTRELLK